MQCLVNRLPIVRITLLIEDEDDKQRKNYIHLHDMDVCYTKKKKPRIIHNHGKEMKSSFVDLYSLKIRYKMLECYAYTLV